MTPEQIAKAAEIAALIGATPCDRYSQWTRRVYEMKDGGLLFTGAPRNGRDRNRLYLDACPMPVDWSRHVLITVSMRKSAGQIVAEMDRRLLPDYLRLRDDLRGQAQEDLAKRKTQHAQMTELAGLLQARHLNSRYERATEDSPADELRAYGDGAWHAQVRWLHAGNQGLRLTLDVDFATAKRLCKVLAKTAAHSQSTK